jgi:hypothetical protein
MSQDGSNTSTPACRSFSMNDAHSSRGVMPLASPAAMKAAGRHAHVVVQPRKIDAVQRFAERAQRADFIDGPQRAATGQGQGNAGRLWTGDFHGASVVRCKCCKAIARAKKGAEAPLR